MRRSSRPDPSRSRRPRPGDPPAARPAPPYRGRWRREAPAHRCSRCALRSDSPARGLEPRPPVLCRTRLWNWLRSWPSMGAGPTFPLLRRGGAGSPRLCGAVFGKSRCRLNFAPFRNVTRCVLVRLALALPALFWATDPASADDPFLRRTATVRVVEKVGPYSGEHHDRAPRESGTAPSSPSPAIPSSTASSATSSSPGSPQTTQSLGSGVVIDDPRHVLTNEHVVSRADCDPRPPWPTAASSKRSSSERTPTTISPYCGSRPTRTCPRSLPARRRT